MRKRTVGDHEPDASALIRALRIVAITPPRMAAEQLADGARAAVAGGATAIMVRFPELPEAELVARGKIVAELSRELGFYFILNGSPEAALAAGADAVHLGVRTVGPRTARALVGSPMAIGYSVHFPFDDHLDEIASCSYITYSPVFATASKIGAAPLGAEEFMRAARGLDLPVVALGGIDPSRAAALSRKGCRCVAAISAIFGGSDPAEGAALVARGLATKGEE